MKTLQLIAISCLTLFVANGVWAGPEEVPAAGKIRNSNGQTCMYVHATATDSKHFQSLPNTVGVMKFQPGCLKATDADKIRINQYVARWYGGSADFYIDPVLMRSRSALQHTGQCIQSKTRKNRAIVIQYDVENGSITYVAHAVAVQGCLS